jgi:hypothetical protein
MDQRLMAQPEEARLAHGASVVEGVNKLYVGNDNFQCLFFI